MVRLGLFCVFVAIPLLEIALLVWLGQWIGFWWTIAIVIGTAVSGAYVLHSQGFKVMRRMMDTMAAGRPPVGPVVDGAFLMLAGLLLITPGLITDTAGLVLLIPPLRHRIAAWSVRRFLRSARVQATVFTSGTRPGAHPRDGQPYRPSSEHQRPPHASPAGDGPVIDGEFERVEERTVDQNRRRNNGHAGDDSRDRH
jgi:UPF0716 protein FxsA